MQNCSAPATGGHPSPPSGPTTSDNPSRPRNRSFRGLGLVFFTALIIVAVITYAVVETKLAKMPTFRVDSLSLTNFSSSSSTSTVTGTWQVGFLVQNRNKNMAVNYYKLGSTVYYDNACLSESQHSPFRQGSTSETTLNVAFSAVDVYVEPCLLDGINREREGGSVGFDVKVDGSIGFGPPPGSTFTFSESRELHVLCTRVLVAVSSNSSYGNLVGGATECKVY